MSFNDYASRAVTALVFEVFSHIEKKMDEKYKALAQENNTIRNITVDDYFITNGIVYPNKAEDGSVKRFLPGMPPLHYSLHPKFEAILRMPEEADAGMIKNFFIAVMAATSIGVPLDKLLPSVLVNSLRNEFESHEFDILDNGNNAPTDINAVKRIQSHYGETITSLRMLLMEQLLTG